MTQSLERSNGNGSDYSMASLERRIRLNQQSGWGLEKGTGAQLNLLALFCQKHHLLPGDDVTLYEGKPWITVDGRVKLLRRNHRDEYRGFTQRPLSNDEKVEWGWSPKDIVVETTIRTVTYGEIKAYGRVSLAEAQGTSVQGVRHNPVARFQPVEMAMKRSLARAERFAFGTESLVDDDELEDAARTVIEERDANQDYLAQRHREIFSEEQDEPPAAAAKPSSQPNQGAPVGAPDKQQASVIVDKAHAAARQREMDLAEIDRQRREEGLIS
jgi:hypothetical protein